VGIVAGKGEITMPDHVVLLTSPGGISAFSLREQAHLPPGPGEVRIRHHAIGVNFLDIYHRTGLYALPSYPAAIGAEAAGVVEEVGSDVTSLRAGDRVAYAGPPVGAYCSVRNMAATRVVPLPDNVSIKTAASSLLKGMTAFMLLQHAFKLKAGHHVLIHAAAGGLGGLLVRSAKAAGATVIGTASTAEKAALAVSYGADHVIVGQNADLVAEVRKLTGGLGADVVCDGIGADMLLKSLHAVRPFGTVLTIGQAAGPIPPVPVEELRPGKTLSHPSIMAWVSDPQRYREAAHAAIDAMQGGIVAEIAAEYALADVGRAHAEMEAGRIAGSILLMP
jgi:NADPH2:quinone reductase